MVHPRQDIEGERKLRVHRGIQKPCFPTFEISVTGPTSSISLDLIPLVAAFRRMLHKERFFAENNVPVEHTFANIYIPFL